MAGLIQALLGLVGIGRFIAFTPSSVISGFMPGIGTIIPPHPLPFMGMAFAEGAPARGGGSGGERRAPGQSLLPLFTSAAD